MSGQGVFRGPEYGQVVRLLRRAGLPYEDLQPAWLEHYFGCGEPLLCGVVGVQPFGRLALLRSLAVDAAGRGRGCGARLLARAEAHARELGVRRLYLLTDTAEDYFAQHGYARLSRSRAPAAIRGSAQFAALCPASARLMAKALTPAAAAASRY